MIDVRWKTALVVAGCIPSLVAAAPAAKPLYAVTARIAAPDGGWDYASFDPADRRLFVARSDAVTAIDVDTGNVVQLASASRAHAVLPIPGTSLLAETDGTTGSVRLIDRHTGAVTAQIAVGEKPDAAIYDPVTNSVIVINAKSGTVSIIDPLKASLTSTISLKPGLEFAAIDDHRQLFVNNEDTNEMEVVDLATGTVKPSIALPGCLEPSGLTYSPSANRLIAACANCIASIVDPRAGRQVGTVAIGKSPDAVILDEPRGLAFIPSGGSGTLEILKLSRGSVKSIGRVGTEVGARTGALDPKTGKLYLPTARYGAAVAGQARPPQITGSFGILVVSPTTSVRQ